MFLDPESLVFIPLPEKNLALNELFKVRVTSRWKRTLLDRIRSLSEMCWRRRSGTLKAVCESGHRQRRVHERTQ